MRANPKIGAVITGLLTLLYVGLLANTGITLLVLADPVAKAMGALILVFPLFALWLTVLEFRFGLQLERLTKLVETQGKLPDPEFEYRPSGRPTRESAMKVFAEYAKQVEANESDYLAWYALGVAYDACGDRRRARAAMRRAIKLSRG